jgi:hypothetical protein
MLQWLQRKIGKAVCTMTRENQPKQTQSTPTEPSKSVCIKNCLECGLTEIRCCLNCAYLSTLREFPSFEGLAEDDWRGRMFAPLDTVGFFCNLDRTIQEHKVSIADLPQVCSNWKPRFYKDSLTNQVREKVSLGGE